MKKIVAIIISMILVISICPTALAEGVNDTVRHAVTQRVPSNLLVSAGTTQSGAVGDLKYITAEMEICKRCRLILDWCIRMVLYSMLPSEEELRLLMQATAIFFGVSMLRDSLKEFFGQHLKSTVM